MGYVYAVALHMLHATQCNLMLFISLPEVLDRPQELSGYNQANIKQCNNSTMAVL